MQDHVYAILGATGGIGGALSRRLAARGAHLVFGARDGARLDALVSELGGAARSLDAAEPEEVAGLCDLALETHGRFDGIVNCVGSILLRPAHLTKPADFDEVVRANLRTAFATVHAGASALQRTGGSIVLCSTAAARTGLPNHEAIAAAKAGVIGLALSAAATYAGKGLRVNVVAPGLVDTPLAAQITGNERALETSRAMHPLGRIGKPEDVASAIEWLLGPEQGWVTGQVLGVDGGLGTIRGR